MFGCGTALTALKVWEPGGGHVLKITVLEIGILVDKSTSDFPARPFFRMVNLWDDLLNLASQIRPRPLRPFEFFLYNRDVDNVQMIMVNIMSVPLR